MGVVSDSVAWEVVALMLGVVAVVVALLYHYLTSTHGYWERLDVPYVPPELFYGNVKDVIRFKKSCVEVFSEFYDRFKRSGFRFGGIFQLRAPVLLVCCADLAKDIFVKNFPHFHDREVAHDEHFDPLSAHLIALKGEKWKYVRSKLNPAFTTSKLKGMLEVMRQIGESYVEILEKAASKGEAVELRNSFARYAMDIIAAIAFGLDVKAFEEESKFVEMGRRFFEASKLERISQTIANSFPRLYKMFRLRMVSKKTTDFFMKVIKETMDHRRQNNIQRNDFLHFLMKIEETKAVGLKETGDLKGVEGYNARVNENSIELTEGVIAAQAFVFFLAGYETSSSTMSACIHELARRPDVQQRMYEEIENALESHGALTDDALQHLVYVEQVIKETLRMYPPVGVIIRKCTKPYPIPGTRTTLPEGCQAFIPVYSFHYDPDYFPEPEKFRPERFSPENAKRLVPYSFMPFGHGPRVCIGARLAMMEMKMSVALVIKNFKIEPCDKTRPFRINPRTFFLSPIDGLWVRLVSRTSKKPESS